MPNLSPEHDSALLLARRNYFPFPSAVPTDSNLRLKAQDDGQPETILCVEKVLKLSAANIRRGGRVALLTQYLGNALDAPHYERKRAMTPAFDDSSFDMALLLRPPTPDERLDPPYRPLTQQEIISRTPVVVASGVFELLKIIRIQEVPEALTVFDHTGIKFPHVRIF